MNNFDSEEENKSTKPNRKNSESLYLDVDYNVESNQPIKEESVIGQSVRLGVKTIKYRSKQIFLIFTLSSLTITMITILLLTSNIRGATVFVKVMTQDGKYINNAKITFLNKASQHLSKYTDENGDVDIELPSNSNTEIVINKKGFNTVILPIDTNKFKNKIIILDEEKTPIPTKPLGQKQLPHRQNPSK
ncbi:MAG: hypothetical protein ACKO11_03385 [Cuspidothrix sp.]